MAGFTVDEEENGFPPLPPLSFHSVPLLHVPVLDFVPTFSLFFSPLPPFFLFLFVLRSPLMIEERRHTGGNRSRPRALSHAALPRSWIYL